VFAIPGICALIVFMLARPQELVPLLQKVPFLDLFALLAAVGWVIDVRLRRLQPLATPTLPWIALFMLWAIICTAVVAPEALIGRLIELGILFVLYGTIAHAIQRFRTFQLVAGVLVSTCLFISLVCFHQGLASPECVGGTVQEADVNGTPDGRECETSEQCRGPDAVPGMEYSCEKVGLFGTYSVDQRVRYLGELHDPNEVSLTIAAGGLSLMIAFLLRKKDPLSKLGAFLGIVLVLVTIVMTGSRGGLVAAMLVPAAYVLRRYGIGALIPAVGLAVPVLMLGGRSGEGATESTQLRYEAWRAGLDMFHHNPVFGVGAGMFPEHHFITAHNSYVLTLAEMGLPGMFLFVTVLYLSMKCLIVGLRELSNVPGTDAAQVWGMSLIASLAGILFQINTLSFAYHPVLWIFVALVGAWCGTVRHHRPDFTVKMAPRDIIIVALICTAYATFILPIFLSTKGA
jgi:O-antigen ligase